MYKVDGTVFNEESYGFGLVTLHAQGVYIDIYSTIQPLDNGKMTVKTMNVGFKSDSVQFYGNHRLGKPVDITSIFDFVSG